MVSCIICHVVALQQPKSFVSAEEYQPADIPPLAGVLGNNALSTKCDSSSCGCLKFIHGHEKSKLEGESVSATKLPRLHVISVSTGPNYYLKV